MKLTDLPLLRAFTNFQLLSFLGVPVASQTYITGLVVTKHVGADTLDISAGSCYDPSSGKIISYAGGSGVSAGSLSANQLNQVYIYDSSGTATIEVVNNADPPSTAYAGTARQGGTNSNRRWIGAFVTDGSGNVLPQDVKESATGALEVLFLETPTRRVISGGTDPTFGTSGEISLVIRVPRYVATGFLVSVSVNFTTTAAADAFIQFSANGVDVCAQCNLYVPATNAFPNLTMWSPIEPSVPGIWYLTGKEGGSGNIVYVDLFGYRMAR